MLMEDLELWLALATIILGGGIGLYRIYQDVMEDGRITREELLDALKNAGLIVSSAAEDVEENLDDEPHEEER